MHNYYKAEFDYDYRIPLFRVIKSLIYNFCKKEFALRKDFFVGDIIGIRP